MICPLSTVAWIGAIAAALCVGLSKAGFGGFGMVAVLLMTELFPGRQSTGILLPLLIVADLFAVTWFRRQARWHLLLGLLPPTVVGVVLGWFILPHLNDKLFVRLVGWLVLVLVAVQTWRMMRVNDNAGAALASHPIAKNVTGILAGITTMLANAAGAVMTIYLLAARLPKLDFVGTAAVFFLGVNLVKVPFSAGLGLITPATLWLNLVLVPAVVGGLYIGKFFLRRIPQRPFEILLLVFTALAAIRMAL